MKRRRTRDSALHSERGLAIAELCVLVPIVVFMGFSAIEFTRVLRIEQAISVIAREVANESFRLCAASSRESATQCLHEVLTRTHGQVGNVLPAIQIIATVYDVNRTGGTIITETAQRTAGLTIGSSKVSIGDARIVALASNVDVIVVGEVYYNSPPPLGVVRRFFPNNSVYYDASIF